MQHGYCYDKNQRLQNHYQIQQMAFSSRNLVGFSTLGGCRTLQERCDLRKKMQIPPSQESGKKKAHKHKSFWPVTLSVTRGSPDRETRGQSFMYYPRNPRNINLFIRIPDREGPVTGATGKSFMCRSFMCLFCSLRSGEKYRRILCRSLRVAVKGSPKEPSKQDLMNTSLQTLIASTQSVVSLQLLLQSSLGQFISAIVAQCSVGIPVSPYRIQNPPLPENCSKNYNLALPRPVPKITKKLLRSVIFY